MGRMRSTHINLNSIFVVRSVHLAHPNTVVCTDIHASLFSILSPSPSCTHSATRTPSFDTHNGQQKMKYTEKKQRIPRVRCYFMNEEWEAQNNTLAECESGK